MTDFEYLLANGWLPSPTTGCGDGAWEHPRLCRVPVEVTNATGAYSDGIIRIPTGHAMLVQLAEERNAGVFFAEELERVVKRKIERVHVLLAENGCDCNCGHHHSEHDDDCMRCLACRIEDAVSE